jgi:glycine/D-amino acid oxidase-like deaminating enzyme
VGGSIAGVSTALFLIRQGMPVLPCEKGILGGEQSSRN